MNANKLNFITGISFLTIFQSICCEANLTNNKDTKSLGMPWKKSTVIPSMSKLNTDLPNGTGKP